MKLNPKVNLKLFSKKLFEWALIISLALHISLFLAFTEFEGSEHIIDDSSMLLEVEDIPETEQFKKPPPPASPAVPIESEDEDLMDDITIEDTEIFDFSNFDAPPPPPPIEEEEIPDFLPLADQPKIIGGLAALQKLVEYPIIARKAGVEGLVTIGVLIDKEGFPVEFRVLKSLGQSGCDEAAIEAIKKIRFTPGKQRGKAIKCWVNIPIRYRLTGIGGS